MADGRRALKPDEQTHIGGNAGRNFRIDRRPANGAWVEAGRWLRKAPAQPIPAKAALGHPRGDYVRRRYRD